MADELVSINNLKENILEFDLSVEGLSSKDIDAKFVIHSNDMELAFPCKKNESGKWSVTLPPLPMLERTAYPFHFQVIAEGYHFQPLHGSVNVVGSPEVYASGTKNTKLASPSSEPAVKEQKTVITPTKIEPTKGREKPIEQVARELMEGNKVKAEKAKTQIKPVVENLLPKINVEEKKETATAKNDQAVRKVLEDLGIQPAKTKSKKRFTLKH